MPVSDNRPYVQFDVRLGDGTRTWSKERYWGDRLLLRNDKRAWLEEHAGEKQASLDSPLEDGMA